MDARRPLSVGRMTSATIVWGAAFAALAVLTVAVLVVDGPLPGEIGVIGWLQAYGQPVPAFADVLRLTTGTEGNLVMWAIPAVLLVRRFGRRGVHAVVICLLAMLVVQPLAKVIVDRDRPTSEQVEVRADHSSKAYPSGHSMSTTTTFGLSAVLAWRSGRRRLAIVAVVPIVATGFASGIHGVHWASDAIAGTILGAAAAHLAANSLLPIAADDPGLRM